MNKYEVHKVDSSYDRKLKKHPLSLKIFWEKDGKDVTPPCIRTIWKPLEPLVHSVCLHFCKSITNPRALTSCLLEVNSDDNA